MIVSAPLSYPTLTARFGLVLHGLRNAISHRAATPGLLATPRLVLLWSWLSRLAQRFEAVVTTPARLRPESARSKPARASKAGAAKSADRPSLPRGWRWLRAAMPGHHLPGCINQIRHLLADPEMAELLARDPRAARLLRPLCRRLGIKREPELPACLFPSPRRRPPKPRPEPAAPIPPPPVVPSVFPRPRRRQYPNLPDLGERWPDLPLRQLRRWRPPKPS